MPPSSPPPPYYFYVNTMVFTIVSGVVSMLLLLALIYVPSVTAYAPLIVTVQVGLIFVILVALVRIWLERRKRGAADVVSNQNTLSVSTCPDYMVAGPTDPSEGGGTTCYNTYDGTPTGTPVWLSSGGSGDQNQPPNTLQLSQLDGQGVGDVCAAVNFAYAPSTTTPPSTYSGGLPLLPNTSLAEVPWVDLRSRCSTYA